MLAIQSGVPIPSGRESGAKCKYPFEALKVGDSFFVPNVTAQKLSNAATWHKKKTGRNFTCATVDGGARCWRVA